LKRQINQSTDLLAARPAEEATRMFALIGTGIDLIRVFAVILIAAAIASVFATLLAALNARRGEVALLRAMGATRGDVFTVLLGQGLAIGVAGVALGLAGGHGLLNLLAATSDQARDFGVTGLAWHPGEWVILAGGVLAGALAALAPAIAAYRTDIAKTLSEAP
jgi:putative ABC transport system permease protein